MVLVQKKCVSSATAAAARCHRESSPSTGIIVVAKFFYEQLSIARQSHSEVKLFRLHSYQLAFAFYLTSSSSGVRRHSTFPLFLSLFIFIFACSFHRDGYDATHYTKGHTHTLNSSAIQPNYKCAFRMSSPRTPACKVKRRIAIVPYSD